jgi:hypothetical protein
MKAMAGVDMSPQLATVVTGADDVTRCRWATETGRDLTGYHDQEWGDADTRRGDAVRSARSDVLRKRLVVGDGLRQARQPAPRFTDSTPRPWER